MHSSHTFTAGSAVFDEQNLVSAAGLVPVLELAEQTGLSRLIGEHVELPSSRVASGRGEPGREADHDYRGHDVRRGQHRRRERAARRRHAPGVRRGVRALDAGDLSARVQFRPRQPARRGGPRASVRAGARAPRCCRASTSACSWTSTRCCARCMGRHKQGASFGHAKIAGQALLRRGLSPLVTTLSTATGGAGDRRGVAARRQDRLRPRRRPTGQAGHHHRPSAAGAGGKIMLRGDSAFGTKKVIGACLDERDRVLADPEPEQACHQGDRGHR